MSGRTQDPPKADPDEGLPRTWSLALQAAFWSGSGPGAEVAGAWTAAPFGPSISWLNPQAREFWARVICGTREVPRRPPEVWKSGGERAHCQRCGTLVGGDDLFCKSCGGRFY